MRPPGPSRTGGRRAVVFTAALAATLVSLPIIAVASSILLPFGANFYHLAETILPTIILNTIGLMIFVGAGTILIGVSTAWLVTACRFPGSRAFEWLLLLPLAMPAYIIGYAYTDTLAFAGPVQSFLRETFAWRRGDYWFPDVHSLWGVSLMLTLVLYPYVYLLARTAFLDQCGSAVDAARTLGHSPWSAFWTIALPLARPAIAAGTALALMEALADFGTVEYFGVQTFTTAIYRTWFGMGDLIAAAQLASGLLLFVFLLVAVERWSRRTIVYHGGRKHHAMRHFTLRGWQAPAAAAVCALPVLLGFVVPVGVLFAMHQAGGDPFFGERFLVYARNSFALASLGAVLIVAVAVALSYAVRLGASRPTTAMVRFATLGYALPGTVIAVGVLVPLGIFDNAVDSAMRSTFGVSTGLLLSGTLVAVLFAYLVRFLAIGYGAIDSGFSKISRSVDDAARVLGSSAGSVCRRIHLPLLRRSLLAGGIVVFVDILKELPATLIVRPFNFDTLAVRVYQLASDERLLQASTGALTIVAIGLVPVILLTRMIAEDRRAAPQARVERRPEALVAPAE